MSRSLQVLLLVAAYLLTVSFLPESTSKILYSLSTTIKELLLWMLPVTVTFFIAHAISTFQKKALLFVVSLFLFEALSNFISVWYAYGCAHFVTPSSLGISAYQQSYETLFSLPFKRPPWWSADKGTLFGIVLGLAASFLPLRNGITFGKTLVEKTLTKVFARLIPLFVLGFVAKMYKLKFFTPLFADCSIQLFSLLFFLSFYIVFIFAVGGGPPPLIERIKNLVPATALAFSSGCSLSTMPLTISGTAKNLKNPELANGVIPATTNIQQVGDCIVNGFFCFMIYAQVYGHPPTLATWATFSLVFILARFATAAVLGGAIFLMLPIYETYLGFTPEMIALILAFNVLLDPIVTASNVLANGAMCRVFERYWERVQGQLRLQGH